MQESFVEHIVLYRSEDGRMTLDVNLREDTLWLTQKQMGMLFETERSVITKHVNNILKTGELHLDSVCANVARTAEDGKSVPNEALQSGHDSFRRLQGQLQTRNTVPYLGHKRAPRPHSQGLFHKPETAQGTEQGNQADRRHCGQEISDG